MSIKSQVRTFLKTADLLTAAPADVCDLLDISESKLRRDLAKSGCSWRQLVLSERQWRCGELLAKNPQAGLGALAEVCGYAEKQSMGAAFECWYDQTITEWRKGLAA